MEAATMSTSSTKRTAVVLGDSEEPLEDARDLSSEVTTGTTPLPECSIDPPSNSTSEGSRGSPGEVQTGQPSTTSRCSITRGSSTTTCSITRGSIARESPNGSPRGDPSPRELPPTLPEVPLPAPSSSARETSIASNTGMQVQDSVADSFLRACKSGNLASVQRNSDQAELSNTRDRHGNTGLILAAEYGQANVVSHLAQLDEDPLHINAANEAGRTALMVAVDRGRRKVVEILLHHPSTIRSITDRFGITAQDIANLRQDARIVELLGGTSAPAIARPAPPPARHEQSRELAADRASMASTISESRRSLGRTPSHPLAGSETPPPQPMSSGNPRRAKSTKESKDAEKQRIQRARSRTRSLSRSIDETQIESEEFAKRREDDILGDIRSKIEAKIKNYEDLIE